MLDLSKICDAKIEGIDHCDAPDYVDAYISEAWFDEGDGKFRELTESEIDWLNDQSDYVYKKVIDWIY